MRHLSLAEVLELHRMVVEQAGGAPGLRDLEALESAVAQPRMTFGGNDPYRLWSTKLPRFAFPWSRIIVSLTETNGLATPLWK